MTTTERLHRLVDELPERERETAVRVLEGLAALTFAEDPVAHALAAAPDDDEPETDEERAVTDEARAEMRRGDVVPHPELRRRLLGA